MYIYVMTQLGKHDKVQEYREKCKEKEYGDDIEYSYFIHGWFLVWLEE